MNLKGIQWEAWSEFVWPNKWKSGRILWMNIDFHKMRGNSLLHKVALGSQEGMCSIRLVSVPSFPNYELLIGMETEVEEIPLVVCIYSGTVLRTCT
jgi:hypothetical protein